MGYEGSFLVGFFLIFGIVWLIGIVVSIFFIICMWKVYKKAGYQGWEAIVPVYNIIVLLEITSLPLWYIALFFVPFANIYVIFKIFIELAHKFDKSTTFGVLMVFFSAICIPILALGDSVYINKNNNVKSEIIYCTFCGQKVSADSLFCTSCGSKI